MVTYSLYVRLLSQLSQKNRARIEVCDRELVIVVQEENWVLSTFLCEKEDLSFSSLRWQSKGAHIQLDPSKQHLLLVQEMKFPTYLSFKGLVQDFVSVTDEWQELLSNNECVC